MTASELASYHSGPALVAYLSQPDASATACDIEARGPHIVALVPSLREALVRGLLDGRVAPALWLECADAILKRAPPEEAASLMDDIGHAYRSLMTDSKFETALLLQARVSAMQTLYLDRKNRIHDSHDTLESLFTDLRAALAARRLGPIATRFGAELIAAVDLEHGQWKGHAVDAPLLDSLFGEHDETTLKFFVDRLPNEDLRNEARRRIIRLHIATSPFPEVRASADDVEERVLIRGANSIALDKQAPSRGWLEERNVPMRGVLVRQDIRGQTATLLGYRRNNARPLSVLPEVQLRGALMVDVSGISRPVTLCAPKKELDPTPCIAAGDVQLGNPVAYLDKGVFRFVDRMPMSNAVSLTSMHDHFVLPISVAGKSLTSFEWPFHYERPESLVLDGLGSGMNGPNLVVKVDRRDPSRYIFNVSGGSKPYWAVIEAYDADAFVIASRGARGETGSTGSSGSPGSNGSECSSGGPGGDGGPGGPGGDGGDGGNVDVEVDCGDASCTDAVALLRRTVGSLGGAAGFGGSGGSGGAGGSGGSARSPTTHTDSDGNTVVDDPGCSAGSSGSPGSDGFGGAPGAPGRSGTVTIRVRGRSG